MREWFNINELAEKTNIPDTSVRRYIAKFPHFFLYKGGARSRRYEDSSVKVLIRIKNLYDNGYETEQADEILRQEFPMIVDGDKVTGGEEKAVTPALATSEDVAELKEAIALLLEKSKRQEEFNRLLSDKLDQQQKYIEESLNKRDQLLLESIREKQEEKLDETAAAQEKEEKSSFFSRLFGKK